MIDRITEQPFCQTRVMLVRGGFEREAVKYFKLNFCEGMNKKMLSYNLKVLRKTHNLTQNDASNIFGVKRAAYASYEENRSIPNIFVFMNICNYYKIEPKKILTKKIKINYE